MVYGSSTDFGNDEDPGEEEMHSARSDTPPSPETGSKPEAYHSPRSREEVSFDAEGEAFRQEMAALGFVPVDPNTLKDGEPLSRKDWQLLWKYHRHPQTMSYEDRCFVREMKRHYRTWYNADKEAMDQLDREIGEKNLRRN